MIKDSVWLDDSVVPSQDSADNLTVKDVIGSKTDTVSGNSLVSLNKINKAAIDTIDTNVDDIETNTENIESKIDVIDNFHDLPDADSSNNSQIRDILGNKNDTISGNSIMAYLKNNYKKILFAEDHIHRYERWYGKSADQSGNDWALEDSLTPFRAISGNGAYGSDANDEAKVFGTEDTPLLIGQSYFDPHRILVVGVSNDDPYIIRFVWGTGTMAAAISAQQYSTTMIKFDSTNPQLSAGIPLDVGIVEIAIGNKLWVQVKNGTDNATFDFFIGAHGYVYSS